MKDHSMRVTKLPPEQQAIRAKCFHPTGTFVEFKEEEIEQSIPDRFEQMVRLYPERLAVKTTNHTLTYAELNATANCVAGAILARSGERAEPIALLLDHGISAIASILGILKAGKIFVPLEPAFSHDRISFILEHSRAVMLLTNREYISTAKTSGLPILNVDELDPAFSSSSIGLSLSGDNLASLIHTSGSTGGSKGVFQNHRNILHKVANYTNSSHISAEDRLSLVVSLTFSAVVPNIFGALLNGASLFPFDIKKDGLVGLARWLIDEEITIYQSVTGVFRHLVGVVTGKEEFPSLRLIDLFGEPVILRDVELYKTIFSPRCLLRNRMASTETGDFLQYFMDKATQIKESIVPVGFPVEDMEVLLLDDGGREADAKQLGEITIKSRYLALGYWDQPNLTRTVFLSDPKSGKERIYLTGDLGRKLSDGCILHLGRKDSQVKIRGNKVAMTEIESTLLTAATVKEAVVVAWEDVPGDKRLVAYIVPTRQPAPTARELRGVLAENLPDYMIPSTFVFLEALPLTPNGKVDRKALPEPSKDRLDLGTPFVAPRTQVEKVLAKIWAEVLSLDRVGIHDSFFDLGGHSLAATRVVSQVIKQFQLEIPLQLLFTAPTIAEMAAVIDKHQEKIVSEEELDRMLSELESVSNEEARDLLRKEMGEQK